jgi:membrane protein required for colicin V production
MAVIDWVIIGILAVSGLISLKRGFVREAMSLATWIAAFFVARLFADKLAVLLQDQVENPVFAFGAAYIILFIATLLAGAAVNYLFSQLVKMTGLSGTDRFFGIIFGVVRGGLIIVVCYTVLKIFSVDKFWDDSLFVPYLEPVSAWATEYVELITSKLHDVSEKVDALDTLAK